MAIMTLDGYQGAVRLDVHRGEGRARATRALSASTSASTCAAGSTAPSAGLARLDVHVPAARVVLGQTSDETGERLTASADRRDRFRFAHGM